MIIVEGPDNSGKSTLIKRLMEDFDLLYGPKFNIPKIVKKGNIGAVKIKMAVHTHYNDIIELLKQSPRYLKPYIFDRVYFSELVYGNVYRGGIAISLTGQVSLPILIKEANPLIIYCNPPVDLILQKYDEREQYGEHYDLSRIVNLYDNIFSEGGLYVQDKNNFLTYNYAEDDYEFIKKQVEQYLKEEV